MLKLVTILNWAVIAFLVYAVAMETIFPAKGGDAAGRGIGQAIYYMAIGALVLLVVLNLLPYRWTKYAAFALVAIPILYLKLEPRWQKMKRLAKNAIEESKPIFPDEPRERMARAIHDGNPEKLKELLQVPPPNLNEEGELLAFAINETNGASYKPVERLACLKLLFQAGARLDSLGTEKRDICFAVASTGDAALLRLLLEQGADAKAMSSHFNYNMLFEAIMSYKEPEASVRVLLEFGADPNATARLDDEQGSISSLVRAAEVGRWGVCAALVEHGADIHFKTKNGLSLKTFMDDPDKNLPETGYSNRPDFERLEKLLRK
jgi:hypothetical protein